MNFKTKCKNKLVPVSNYQASNGEKTVVSVCVGTYNQIDYVEHCLDSILSQLVNFKVEILINDDASSDGTQELLLDYQKRFPQIIKVFLSEENQFQKTKQYSIVYRVHAPRISGKYVALCDSDDYYCNNLMLYSKVLALEKHKECNACFSRVRKMNESNKTTIHLMPKRFYKTGVISSKKLIGMFTKSYCFQTSSYFFKADKYIEFCNNYPTFAQKINVFDEPVVMYFGSLGKVYYINEVFSVYRKFSNNSWSNSKNENDISQRIIGQQKRIDYLEEFNKSTGYRFNKACNWGITHSKITIYKLSGDIDSIFKDKQLLKFYKRRYFKNYIKLKYFKH